MAFPKVIIAFLFLSLLVLIQVQALQTDNQPTDKPVSGTPYQPALNCGGACAERCKLSSRPRLCKRACGSCCARCSCVPKGTYGNYADCPCYATMTTKDNKPKCP